ncbi:hypothetical protein PJ267_19800 [Arthrobacter sp. OVS8]|nr:hypothetical protein PJ267_19800 [Arthrobacter sp. OVS8]
MFDTAAAGFASPLFIVGIGLAGMCLGLIADALVRRTLPRLAGDASWRAGMTTAAAAFVLSALLAWRFGATAELPAYVLLGIFAIPLARIDIVHHLLPNWLVGPLLAAGFALLGLAALTAGAAGDLLRGAAGSVILFFFT